MTVSISCEGLSLPVFYHKEIHIVNNKPQIKCLIDKTPNGVLTSIDSMSVRFLKYLEAPVIKEPEMASLTNMEQPINKTIFLFGLENPQTVQFIIKSKLIFSGYK
jgi:hypothetical protein